MADNTDAAQIALKPYLYPSLIDTSLESIWSEELCQQIEARFSEENDKPCSTLPKTSDARDTLDLYKYRSFDPRHFERTKQVVCERRLWSPSIKQLNDPMEAAVVFGSGSIDEWTVPAIATLYRSPWCGCICFSYDAVCPQMWAHYADNHRGYVLKYERLSNFLLRSPYCQLVQYRREVSVVDFRQDSNVLHPLWVKSEAWEYEREVRLLYPRTNSYTAPGLLRPSGIIFGLRTPDDVKGRLGKICSSLNIGQIVFGDSPYRLKVRWRD